MKNPFEATPTPKQENPKEDLSVDIDFEEEAPHPKGDPAMRGAEVNVYEQGLQRVESKETIEARQPKIERSGPDPHELVAAEFFKENPFLKAAFEKDPDAMRRFKVGLASLVDARSRAYVLEPGQLMSDARFRKDLLTYSMGFEDSERARKASPGRRAA